MKNLKICLIKTAKYCWEKLNKTEINEEINHGCELKDSLQLKYQFSQNLFIDLMHFLLKYQVFKNIYKW